MERHLLSNAKKSVWVIGSFAVGSLFVQWFVFNYRLKQEVFGVDGNGGKMLKIITNLTDEEMARLKFVRRMNWHWRGSRKMFHGQEQIEDQELSDRGIEWKQEEYIEYQKRPPHDKFL